MSSVKIQQPECPVCQSGARSSGTKNGFHLYRCRQCGLLFLWPMPDNTLDIYSGDYFTGASNGFGYVDYDRDKAAMKPTFEHYLRIIRGYRQPPGRLLDVGAATGYFTALANHDGWQASGIEPAAEAVRIAAGKGLDVRQGILDETSYPPESFDVVTLWDVLEHIPDPNPVLSTVARILKPGGVAVFNTPDSGSLWARLMGLRWHLIVPPEHVNLFTARSMRAALQRHGFTVQVESRIGKKFTIQYVLQTLAHWQNLRLWHWLSRSLQGSTLGQIGVPINLRDNMFVLASKRL
jgi:SAM-dependent methyltransferase